MAKILLVNTNQINPPIAPVGLDYLAESASRRGHDVTILDLCWEGERRSGIKPFFKAREFDLVGISLRNTDDCAYGATRNFLGEFVSIVKEIRESTGAVLVVGGVGFSIMPEVILQRCGADAGIWGEGECVFPEMAKRIEKGDDWADLPGIITKQAGRWRRNSPSFVSLESLPPMTRSWLDNVRYFREGGQLGVEAKRGCPGRCIYCADPVAKGFQVRARPVGDVAFEILRLLEQGIDSIHFCDSEFNLPIEHARELSEELIRQRLGDRIRWYAYCSPAPFDERMAMQMRKAGCAGINFGTDSCDCAMLKRLNRLFSAEDILAAVGACKKAGLSVMLDLLLGAPGETADSLNATLGFVKKASPDVVGVSVGVRVYPGTPLADWLGRNWRQSGKGELSDFTDPFFFLEPNVAPWIFSFLEERIGKENNYFFFDPTKPERNYNYNDNERLQKAIQQGYRGAYWDILRRLSTSSSE